MKKKQNNSVHASALQIALALALTSLSVILVASGFAQRSNVSGAAQGLPQRAFQTVNTYTGVSVWVGPVTVTATGGVMGPTNYPTLRDAFDAINAGTHQGNIAIDIVSNTTEGKNPATLNGSGAGLASYTSVLIRPVNDGVLISGNPATGLGVVQLNGASNVTIDGDNPNTPGTNQDLTIQNTVTNTTVVRTALAASGNNHADEDTIMNLKLVGNATGRNVSKANASMGSENAQAAPTAAAGLSPTPRPRPTPGPRPSPAPRTSPAGIVNHSDW